MSVIRWCQRWWRSFRCSSEVEPLLHSRAFLIILSKLGAIRHIEFRACVVNMGSLVRVGVFLFVLVWSVPVYPCHLMSPSRGGGPESECGNPAGPSCEQHNCPCLLPATYSTVTSRPQNKRIKPRSKWTCVCSWSTDRWSCTAQLVLNGANLTTVGALVLTVATQM